MIRNIIFADTIVIIDFLADRKPFSLDAAKLFNLPLEAVSFLNNLTE